MPSPKIHSCDGVPCVHLGVGVALPITIVTDTPDDFIFGRHVGILLLTDQQELQGRVDLRKAPTSKEYGIARSYGLGQIVFVNWQAVDGLIDHLADLRDLMHKLEQEETNQD